MPLMDIFEQDPFKAINTTEAIEHLPYVPMLLGQMGIFRDRPIATEKVAVESRNGVLALVPTSPRGAPPATTAITKRNVRDFPTFRLAKYDTIYAAEVQSIIAFGQLEGMALQNLGAEIVRRQAQIRQDIELTHEHMRLGAIQGIVLDADGTTPLINWFTEFGISAPTEIDFDLDNASPAAGALKKKCHALIRSLVVASTGSLTPMSRVVGLCGDAFFDDLVSHPEVREIYLASAFSPAASSMLAQNQVWQSFSFGGIEFVNYRGTDDGSAVAVGTDKCKFFPLGTDIFEVAWAPGETESTVNRPGQPIFTRLEPEPARDPRYTTIELYSYPLFICKKPAVLFSARRT